MSLPNLNYLRRVQNGEIIVRVDTMRMGSKGSEWIVTGGLLRLRLHEEAGFIEPIFTMRRAGFNRKIQTVGVAVRLTEAGVKALA